MLEAAGFLTHHMGSHILAMNLLAPLIVVVWRLVVRRPTGEARQIAPAAVLQLGLLWGWHTPAVMASAYSVPGGLILMHTSLFAAALWFWYTVLDEAEASRWRALGALLITGKLFCLLGVLLAFAPRGLYARAVEAGFGAVPDAQTVLADQQLAGLIMLIACPATYVMAGVIIAARWVRAIEERPSSYLPEGPE